MKALVLFVVATLALPAFAKRVSCSLSTGDQRTSAWVDPEAGTSGGQGGGDGQYGISGAAGDLSFTMEVFEGSRAGEKYVSITFDSAIVQDEWRQIQVKPNSATAFRGPDRKTYHLNCFDRPRRSRR